MKYISTRGCAPEVGFIDALLAGLAPDGGLYTPKAWPILTSAEIAAFAGRPYARVAADIFGLFIGGDIASSIVEDICEDAYAGFGHEAVAPLRQLSSDRFLLELFHGPTLAFKDVAMQVLARLYEHALAARGAAMTVVCATSGDTGGAAVEAFGGRANVKLVVLYPEGRISEVQRRFMTTAAHGNVRAVAVAGDFDDCQAILKDLFADAAFARAVKLSAVNSINIARIVAQIVYFFTAGAALGAPGRAVSFAVPTGNFGDAFAGYGARLMGLPIERLLVATNGNDIVSRALEGGVYARSTAQATQSPAMDIQVASNFERLYFECAGRDGPDTALAFGGFSASGTLELPPAVHGAMREVFQGVSVSEIQTARAILRAWNQSGELVDPHTAVALAGAALTPSVAGAAPLIVLSTAHAAKFPEAVLAATGVLPAPTRSARDLADRAERVDRMAADSGAVKAYVRAFASA